MKKYEKEHKTTIEAEILLAKMIAISNKIDCANFKDFQKSKTYEEYRNCGGIIDIDEEEFNFLKNPKLKEVEEE